MRFVDSATVKVVAGAGGNGCVAFRREKFIPFGGPSGGDGGDGGSVIFEGDLGMSTLLDLQFQRTIEAARGEHGMGSDCYGRAGADKVVRVPVGTQVFDAATGALVADVTDGGQRVVVAKGGRGGRGNMHFATPTDRAPRRAERGTPGELRELRLELKVLADVGLLGFPNVGKSTFVASVSAARPKVADYPFTTLTPTLGVVEIGGGRRGGGSSFVIADIPGLVPGASEGRGLGIQFLRHVERNRALLHLVSFDPGEVREPLADYEALRAELRAFRPELCERPELVALSKADVTEVREAFPALRKRFARAGVDLRLVSAVTGEGVPELLGALAKIVLGAPTGEAPPERAEAPAPRPAPEKAPSKKAAPKKAAPKKPAPKKPAPKKPAPKKAAPKKPAPKKLAPKKKATQKKKAAPKKKPAPKKAPAKKVPAKKRAPAKGASSRKKAPTKKAPARGRPKRRSI